jgi:integrase/recombinase XerD
MSTKALVPSTKFALRRATRVVPYLTPDEVYQIADAAKESRKGERDELLILTLFQTGLRVSEALDITPRKIGAYSGHWVLYIKGKGRKPRTVACPDSLAYRLKSYAFDNKLGLDDKIFRINRKRAWQIVKVAAEKAGIQKRVFPHLFRHSDAIERLRQTGNPKSLQLHLGHSSTLMTMRYLSTLQEEDSLKIEQQVVFER